MTRMLSSAALASSRSEGGRPVFGEASGSCAARSEGDAVTPHRASGVAGGRGPYPSDARASWS